MIKIKNLSKTFQSGDHLVTAVDDVSLEIPDGIFCAIVGKSGSGKSTLLSMLGALDRPSAGSIEVDSTNIEKLSDRRLIKYRRDSIGFVFQNYNLIPNLSAIENVMLPLEFKGMSKNNQRTRAQELLDQVGINERRQGRKPGKLSGGEQQRVSIARALANQPKFVLADEPTGNLDSNTGKIIIALLKKMAKTAKTTVIAVTHDQSIAESAQLTFHLKDGKLVKS